MPSPLSAIRSPCLRRSATVGLVTTVALTGSLDRRFSPIMPTRAIKLQIRKKYRKKKMIMKDEDLRISPYRDLSMEDGPRNSMIDDTVIQRARRRPSRKQDPLGAAKPTRQARRGRPPVAARAAGAAAAAVRRRQWWVACSQRRRSGACPRATGRRRRVRGDRALLEPLKDASLPLPLDARRRP